MDVSFEREVIKSWRILHGMDDGCYAGAEGTGLGPASVTKRGVVGSGRICHP